MLKNGSSVTWTVICRLKISVFDKSHVFPYTACWWEIEDILVWNVGKTVLVKYIRIVKTAINYFFTNVLHIIYPWKNLAEHLDLPNTGIFYSLEVTSVTAYRYCINYRYALKTVFLGHHFGRRWGTGLKKRVQPFQLLQHLQHSKLTDKREKPIESIFLVL
jgi:hypothetical protein